MISLLDVAILNIYGYGKPLKNKKGEIIGKTLDVKGNLRLPNEVIRTLGVEFKQGKRRIPILIELKDDFCILKVSKEFEHDDIDFIKMEQNSGSEDTTMESITDTIKPPKNQRRVMDTLISTPKSTIQQSLGSEKPVRLFSLHKLPFVYTYEGAQPIRDAYSIRKIGRDGSGRQVYYWWKEDMAGIQVFRNCFIIWIKKPKGMMMDEQIGEARERADAVARKFGMKFGLGNIRLKSEPPSEAYPDVIVEDKSVAKVLDKVAKEGDMPVDITKNKTSHKGKWETNWTKGKRLEKVLEDPLTKTDFLQFKEEMLGVFREFIDELKPKGMAKPMDQTDKVMYG